MSFFIARVSTLSGPPGVRLDSFSAQPPDLPAWLYVYLLDFGFTGNLIRHLALYPVSVRRLLGFATPLPPPASLLLQACGSLRLAVTTRDWTFTSRIVPCPAHQKRGLPKQPSFIIQFILLRFSRSCRYRCRFDCLAFSVVVVKLMHA